jgi:predicted GNAT family acetyltransferase
MSQQAEHTPSDVHDAADARRYELKLQGEVAGFIDYRDRGAVRELVHTEVKPEHEGRGLGQQLARFALDDARRQGRKVVPACSFIAAYVKRHPDTADLVEEHAAR